MLKNIFKNDLNTSNFNVVALLAIRNEALYLEKCLTHLYEQGISSCIIDNDSSDNSLEIAQSFINKGVIQIVSFSFDGYFDLKKQLKIKEKLASEINANWFIHHDADEIRESPVQFENLYQAILKVDKSGYNAINFDEFIFIPRDEYESNEEKDYKKNMKYYFFFEPAPLRRINAWKKTNTHINLVNSGGHSVNFLDRKIYPNNFILRHYIGLSIRHLISKYSERIYSKVEVGEYKWHGWRADFSANRFSLPSLEHLKFYSGNRNFDKSNPCKKHLFIN